MNDSEERVTRQPKDSITLQDKFDIQYLRDANGRARQGMQGFNPRYADIVDYIIGVTHEIWEEKGVGKLYDYYANTTRVHSSDGTLYGRDAVLAATLGTLAAYPDRRLYGDEVIWDGDDQQGYYSSHRLVHSGTNRGWSHYGPPTHNKVRYYAIADCLCHNNMVIEEWLVRDELALVHQLGLDPVQTARDMARREAQANPSGQPDGDIERGVGQLPPPVMAPPPDGAFDPVDFATARAARDLELAPAQQGARLLRRTPACRRAFAAAHTEPQRLPGLRAGAAGPLPGPGRHHRTQHSLRQRRGRLARGAALAHDRHAYRLRHLW